MIRSILRHSSLRYLVVGGLSYCTDAGTLWLLHGFLSVPLALATTLAFAASFVVNFGLNRVVVFAGGREPGGPGLGGQLLRYVTLVIVNYLATLGIVLGLSTVGVNYLAAKTIAVILIAVANYFAYKHWVFADRSRPTAGAAPLEREYS